MNRRGNLEDLGTDGKSIEIEIENARMLTGFM